MNVLTRKPAAVELNASTVLEISPVFVPQERPAEIVMLVRMSLNKFEQGYSE